MKRLGVRRVIYCGIRIIAFTPLNKASSDPIATEDPASPETEYCTEAHRLESPLQQLVVCLCTGSWLKDTPSLVFDSKSILFKWARTSSADTEGPITLISEIHVRRPAQDPTVCTSYPSLTLIPHFHITALTPGEITYIYLCTYLFSYPESRTTNYGDLKPALVVNPPGPLCIVASRNPSGPSLDTAGSLPVSNRHVVMSE